MRKLAAFFSTTIATLAIAGSAFAQTPPAGCDGAQGRPHHRGAAMMQRLDQNQNGVIEVAELPARIQSRLAGADANQDGILAPEELRAHFEAARAAMRARMDTDQDGQISPEERAAAHATRQAARFARLDANQDGAVTSDEVAPERWNHLVRADANGDGRITADELQGQRRHHGRHGARRMHRAQRA